MLPPKPANTATQPMPSRVCDPGPPTEPTSYLTAALRETAAAPWRHAQPGRGPCAAKIAALPRYSRLYTERERLDGPEQPPAAPGCPPPRRGLVKPVLKRAVGCSAPGRLGWVTTPYCSTLRREAQIRANLVWPVESYLALSPDGAGAHSLFPP